MRDPFLTSRPAEDAADVRAAIDRVVERGWFVLGPELEAFEKEFAAAAGAAHAVGVGTGTDALALALRALGIGPGDEVITSPLSAAYSALAIMMVGARPVFADIDPDRLTLDPRGGGGGDHAADARDHARAPLRPAGRHAGADAVAARHGLAVVEDCCQAHLATCDGRPVGIVRRRGASASTRRRTSARSATAARSPPTTPRSPRDCAAAQRRPDRSLPAREFGVNTRLDEMQAAILRARSHGCRGGPPSGVRSAADYRRAAPPARRPCRPSATPATSITCSRC